MRPQRNGGEPVATSAEACAVGEGSSVAPVSVTSTLKESCGNGGSVENVESQRQASHSFHEPLGNFAKDGEIPTFPQLRRRGWTENWKTNSRYSTFPPPPSTCLSRPKHEGGPGYRPPSPQKRSARFNATTSTNPVPFLAVATRRYCRRTSANSADVRCTALRSVAASLRMMSLSSVFPAVNRDWQADCRL
jgi:hypothetical protein